jgi:putative chitinase
MSEPSPKLHLATSEIQSFLQSNEERACSLTALFNKVFPFYQINTLPRVHMAIAQTSHESQMFRHYSENMNYSAAALARTWPLRFASNPNARIKIPNALAKRIEHKPEIIANTVYGNRMGNDNRNDGWNLRGSGAIQLTGKDNISSYAQYKGFSNVYDTAKLMRESDEYAIDSACWFMVIHKGLLDEMDRGHITHVSTAINGALIGIEERKELFQRAKDTIKNI